jgi:two-component sensor histidine kinase
MNPLDILALESRKLFLERQRGVEEGATVSENVEYEIERKDGGRLWALISSTFVYENGEATKAVVVAHDVSQRVEANRQLRATLKEKEVLLQEVHHRVKNNLQLVSSLLDMQSMTTQEPEPLSILQDSRNRVKAMALVHETLYQAADLAIVDVAGYLQGIVRNLVGIYRDGTQLVPVDVQIEEGNLDLDTAIICGLIVNELVSNALKYAFPYDRQELRPTDHKDEIAVLFRQQAADLLELSVRDNGIGIPDDIDLDHARSLGLRLVNMLTQQLQGTVQLDRNGGTLFRISFPKSSQGEA